MQRIGLSAASKRALSVHLAALERAQHGLQAFLQGVATGLGVDPDTHSFDMQRSEFVPIAPTEVAPADPPPSPEPTVDGAAGS